MTPKIILIDQDGVLANYDTRLLEIVAEEIPGFMPLPHEHHTHFEIAKNYPAELWPLFEEITHRPGFYRSLPPIPGAIEALRDLLARGYDVRICTAPKKRSRYCAQEKIEWVREHLGQEFAERTIITRDKTLVHGDILVDDKPEVTGVRTPSWEHILHDRPYNRHVAKQRMTWANYQEILGL